MTTTIKTSELTINPRFDHLLHALHPDELKQLKESIAAEGVQDPVKVWGDVIVDGHNRYRIAKEFGITELPCLPMYFDSDEDAEVWILRNQIGRRNTPEQMRSLYIGRLYERLKATMGSNEAVKTITEKEGVSRSTVFRDKALSEAFERASALAQEQYVRGAITAKDLVDELKPERPPAQPYSKEAQALGARKAFPRTVRIVADRVLTAIDNLRTLCDDVDKVFTNQGEDLRRYAPEIASVKSKLTHEEAEARRLLTLVECPEAALRRFGTNYITEAALSDVQEFRISDE